MKNYCFNINNICAKNGISDSLYTITQKNKPVIACIGTDAVIGDSLGPIIGTTLSKTIGRRTYIYGTLEKPITAKETNYLADYLSLVHPKSAVLAIDAAVGSEDEIGSIKISDSGVKPGLGVFKKLKQIGNMGILGIVSAKSDGNRNFMNGIRLKEIYRMAEIISEGILQYFDYIDAEMYHNLKNIYLNENVGL